MVQDICLSRRRSSVRLRYAVPKRQITKICRFFCRSSLNYDWFLESASIQDALKNDVLNAPDCVPYLGFLRDVATSRHRKWNFLCARKKRCSHPVATSTFATILKVSIFDTIEKSVCYYTRAINFKQLLIPCENFCVNLQHKNKLLTTKTNEQKEEIKIYKLTT